MAPIDALVTQLASHKYNFESEFELREGIFYILDSIGLQPQREFVLDPENRVDFFLDGTAIEVKTRGSRSDLARQVMRYARSPKVTAILVVTTRLQHRLPYLMAGKPIRVFTIARGL